LNDDEIARHGHEALRSAAPLPAFAWRRSLKPSEPLEILQDAPVPSVDPSSTTINSSRIGTASTRRMISSAVATLVEHGHDNGEQRIGGHRRARATLIHGNRTVPHLNRLVIVAPNWRATP